MKKVLFLAVAMFIAVAANAQKGEMAIGGNFSIGFNKGNTNFGVGPKFQYSFADDWRGEASFDYFFKKDYVSQWDINLNVHYLVHITRNFNIYPLAGFTVVGTSVDMGYGSNSQTKVGFNAGGGLEYYFSKNVKANFEGKYQWADGGRGVIAVGVAYVF